ncbi:MAG: serine/threonine-protein kinase [Candidatus Brocadiia bacterium]
MAVREKTMRRRFGEAALAEQQVSVAQLEECLGIQQMRRQEGADVKIGEIFVERGYLNQVQVHLLLTVQRGRKLRMEIGGFKIVDKLGRGAMSSVFQARDLVTGRTVALKVMPPKAAESATLLERFRRESRAAMMLDHPNIVRGITAGEDAGFYYFAMEYVRGRSLSRRIRSSGPLAERVALFIARQVADALHHADGFGLLHRDIKPDNIMVLMDDFVKVTDFGLSRLRTGDDTMLTLPGAAVGTPYYMSPEQARGETDLDIRSDLYSLGATLYEMLTGSPPHTGPSAALVLAQHLTEEPPPPQERNPELSDDAARLIAGLLAKDRDQRTPSPAGLRDEIDALLDERGPRRGR